MDTEAEWIKKWKEGDEEAFGYIYENYKNMAMRTAYLISRNIEDSEDIVQETFVRCHLHIGELKDEKGFKSWMLKILVRYTYHFLKKKREFADDQIEMKMEHKSVPGILEMEIEKERTDQILTSINQLSDKHKLVIILYYYNELSIKEIAKVMGCLEGTVKSRLHFARSQLKRMLNKERV